MKEGYGKSRLRRYPLGSSAAAVRSPGTLRCPAGHRSIAPDSPKRVPGSPPLARRSMVIRHVGGRPAGHLPVCLHTPGFRDLAV